MGSSNFSQTVIGEAVSSAVTDLASKLSQDSGRLPTTTVPVNGLVADASGNQVTINVGSRGGVHVGDTLLVSRVDRVIKDPATGKPLRTVEQSIGKIQITQADDSSAVGTFSGAGQPKIGDTIKNAQ